MSDTDDVPPPSEPAAVSLAALQAAVRAYVASRTGLTGIVALSSDSDDVHEAFNHLRALVPPSA